MDELELARATTARALDDGLVEDLRAQPDGLRVVVAARELVDRDAPSWARHLGWAPHLLELEGLDRNAVHELMPDASTELVSEVMRITEGDPLTAMLLAELADRGEPLVLESTSAGLEGVFQAWWDDRATDSADTVSCWRRSGGTNRNREAI